MNDYEWLTQNKLCHKCRKTRPAPGKKFCFNCLDKIREDNAIRYDSKKAHEYQARRREIYQEKKAAGICVRCNKSATHGLYCYEHSIEVKRRSQKRSQIRKRERHERGLIPEQRRKDGKCLWCGEDAAPGLQCCKKHQEIFSKAGKKGYETNLVNKNNPWINEVEAWKNKYRHLGNI